MALLSVFYDDLSDQLLSRWNNFGLGIHPNEVDNFSGPRSWLNHHHTGYHRPRLQDRPGRDLVPAVIGKDGFQVCLDVHQFAPNEITVKTIDNTVVVDAKHEERQDEHGYISRQFTRRYVLPKEFKIEDVVSQLSSDGVLSIKAPPPKALQDESNVRVLQIQHTGPARFSVGNKEEKKQVENQTD